MSSALPNKVHPPANKRLPRANVLNDDLIDEMIIWVTVGGGAGSAFIDLNLSRVGDTNEGTPALFQNATNANKFP